MTIMADSFGAPHRHQQVKREQIRRLDELAARWGDLIQTGLERLAQELWPDGHPVPVTPVHRYRLRHEAASASHVWWVEHDIPPYDRAWCVAYRVQLAADEQGSPTLAVQSGSAAHPVIPLSLEKLETTLAEVAAELPLIISRQMGPPFD